MEIKNFVKIYDNIIPFETLKSMLRFLNTVTFNEAEIIDDHGSRVEFDVRKTWVYDFNLQSKSLTHVHWCAFLNKIFLNILQYYKTDNNLINFNFKSLIQISALKYKDNGFYNWHVDHGTLVPRTVSCVFLLNNDYEGGNLSFRNPDGNGEWEVEVKPNRMIIWPSNFLYPHTVKPVTKGIRYSVVSWAL